MKTIKLPVMLVSTVLLSAMAFAQSAAPQPSANQQPENSQPSAYELAKERQQVEAAASAARDEIKAARKLANAGQLDEADAKLDAALRTLPNSPYAMSTAADINSEKMRIVRKRQAAAARGSDGLEPIEKINPDFVKEQENIRKLLLKGRSQYAAADYDGAQETFRHIESVDPENAEAKYFLKRIASDKASIGELNRQKTRAQMVEEVTKAWQRPGLYNERSAAGAATGGAGSPLSRKLNEIKLPSVNFNGVELAKVISTLAAITEEYDNSTSDEKGVNIVLIDPAAKNPAVSITVRNLSLKRVLDLVTESVGYQYEVQADTVVVRPGGETSMLETSYFPVTRATVIRMTGVGGGSSAPAAAADPFSAPSSPSGGSSGGEGDGLRNFLSQAGVVFGEGSSLAYDGAGIFVTQTPRNLERIRNILNRYNDVRQVEIEAKFMDVQEGMLEELGVNWTINGTRTNIQTSNENLASAFTNSGSGHEGKIVGPSGSSLPIDSGMPIIPGLVSLGQNAVDLIGIATSIGNFGVDAQIRALSQKKGVDLMSAPKVTVLSGNPANIVVAQELRYPQSYGETRSEVGSSSGNNSSGAGVTITAGTPQDFTTRNVGVELKVTPTVEEDDYSISLDLNPRVTEFEGFVEYGGQSVAISAGTTVTVPSGVFQPVFAVREVSTKVTVWDGATIVMGGLTREEVKKVNDKVPILGDIPFIGRAFQSKGETSSKRNLLVFVTANLVSPGGSLKKQSLKSVQPNSMFQNPTVTTPSGAEPRTRGD